MSVNETQQQQHQQQQRRAPPSTRHKTTQHQSQRGKTLRQLCRNVFKREKNGVQQSNFNPEKLFDQKREWLENQSMQEKSVSWPEHCFEHLVIVGLPHTTDIQEVILSIRREQVRPTHRPSTEATSISVQSEKPNHTPPKPFYPPKLLYQFPEDKPLHMNPDQLVSFCFPHGVTPQLLKRTPSMGALNEVVYGRQHFVHSDQSFVFMQKGGDDLPMFGVCYLVNQMLHTPPGLVKHKFRENGVQPSRHMVAAPRCYCLLSRYPFFELHFQVLNLVLGLERLDSISDYMNEIVKLPPDSSLFNCLGTKSSTHLHSTTADPFGIRAFSASPTPPSVIQVFSARVAAAESDLSSQTQMVVASDGESQQASNETPIHHARDSFSSHFPIGDGTIHRSPRHKASHRSEAQHARSFSGQSFREVEISDSSVCYPPYYYTAIGASDSAYLPSDFRPCSSTPHASTHKHTDSGDSEYFCISSSMPDLTVVALQARGRTCSDSFLLDATARKCAVFRSPSFGDLLSFPSKATRAWSEDPQEILPACQRLLCHFRSLKVPAPGEKIVFVPEEQGLQRIEYTRPKDLINTSLSNPWAERILVEEETAFGLRSWTVMVLCRSLSLDNILSLLAGAMLERQIVFFCSNIGVLTSAVLALIPMLRPFSWQSLILPALPTCYLEFLEAPVPFAMGIQHKTPEIAQRCTDLMRVNLYKDRVKNAPMAHSLPGYKSLCSDLMPWHKKLQDCSAYSRRPSHVVTSPEYIAVEAFLRILRAYLSELMGDLQRHTIKDVSSSNGVSLLLEESFIESFPVKDQPFMKAFSQTQMFSSFVDASIDR